MEEKTIAVILYVIISLIVIVVLTILLSRKKHCENFKKCVCSSDQGGRERVCQDIVDINNLYVTGKLTENSSFKDKTWVGTSPGDVNFPISKGCGWNDSEPTEKKWGKWDFTDFGNY